MEKNETEARVSRVFGRDNAGVRCDLSESR